MKNILILLFAVISLTIASCSKEDITEPKPTCSIEEGDLQLRPFCNFAPANQPNTPFPIAVWYQGSPVNLEGFTFLWDETGLTASAISVSYSQLPVSVTITEVETGCEVLLTLDSSFWG